MDQACAWALTRHPLAASRNHSSLRPTFLYSSGMYLNAREQWILENAEHFVACAFRGRGVYERVQCCDLASAIEAARRISTDRGALIYAVHGHSQALVEAVGPRAIS